MKRKNLTNLKNIKKSKPKKQTKTNKNIKTTNKQKITKSNTKKPQKKTTLKKETIFTKINNWLKKRGLSPIISVILLVVVSVVLVTLILTWGKNYVVEGVKDTKDILQIKPSDASFYVHTKSINEGVVHFNYSPPNELAKEEIIIESYIVANIPEMTEPIEFKSEEPIKLSSTNVLELLGLYAYASTTPDLYIQLITTDNTYIDVKIKDQGMVCTSSGDGSEGNPFVICTASDLDDVRENLAGHYVLGKDIDLVYFSKESREGWEPIGNGYYDPDSEEPTGVPFTGNFDGAGYTIKNLYIDNSNSGIEYTGLFGYVKNATITNVNLENVHVTGLSAVGGLVGYNYGGTIENSYVTGDVNGMKDKVGGLVGDNKGYIKNSYAAGEISWGK